MFASELWHGKAESRYAIGQSIRFNDNDSAYLSKTWSGAGDKQKFTFSFWVKRGNITSRQILLSFRQDVPLEFEADDTLRVFLFGTTALNTNRVFRDPAAFYHIVLSVDSTQSTSSERVRLYVNGQRETSFSASSYPSQNASANIYTSSLENYIGRIVNGSNYFDGYMAEIHFLDGISYGPEFFGETTSEGIWIPKEYTGSYGTNGYKIDGRDSADLGDDESGNGNDFSTSGLAAHDQVSDSPTTSWCVMNPLLNNGCTYTNGNLEVAPPNNTSTHRLILATQGILPSDTNKYYWEITYLNPDNTSNSVNMLGIGELDSGVNPATSALNQSGGYALGYNTSTSNLYSSSVWTANGTPTWSGGFTAGAVYGVAYDGSAKRLYFYENNTVLNSGNYFATYIGSSPLGPGASLYFSPSSSKLIFNMGNNGFTYTPPTGYVALNTTNLGS